MKIFTKTAVVKDGDELHALLLERRDYIREVKQRLREIEQKKAALLKRLAAVNDGEDFMFVSSDGYYKVVNLFTEPGKPDVDVMQDMLLKLRRRIPRKEDKIAAIVRHLSEEEIDLLNIAVMEDDDGDNDESTEEEVE
jgi:hypothetical protein